MGAWGTQLDQCDGTLDFLGDVSDSRSWPRVSERLGSFLRDGGYEDAEEAWAAAELVAAALGRPSTRLEPELATWASGHAAEAQEIRDTAVEATGMIAERSELSELWGESDHAAEWQSVIADLRARLEA